MMVTNTSYAMSAMIAIISAIAIGPMAAQTPAVTERPSGFESRADLEQRARVEEVEHRTSEAWILRNRLEKGDFQEGDRIVVIFHTTAVAHANRHRNGARRKGHSTPPT